MGQASSLADITIIDASDSVAGQFAGRVFADYGADVVLVEPPEGSPIRRAGPRNADSSKDQTSLLFAHINGGKRSIIISDEAAQRLDDLERLAGSADVLIVPDESTATELRRRDIAAILAVATEFGSSGPYIGWQGGELIHQALSGSMYFSGLDDREPVFGTGLRSYFAAGMQLYISIAAALCGAPRMPERPAKVEVSVHEAAAAMEQYFSAQYLYNGSIAHRAHNPRPRGRAQCQGGWVVYFVRPGTWAAMCRVFNADELIDDERFAQWSDLMRNWAEAVAEIQRFATALRLDDVVEAGHASKLVIAPMMDLKSIWEEEHLRIRKFWTPIDDPEGATQWALGPLFRLSQTPCVRSRPAPRLGEGEPRVAVVDPRPPSVAGSDPGEPPGSAGGDRRPLAGIRVLDLTSAWAGPMAAKILAVLGADVIKVEGPDRLDAWRGPRKDPPIKDYYPGGSGGDRPYDRHVGFNTQNHGKRAISLDIKNPAAEGVLQKLAARCDIVIANWSPGALDRSGLGYDRLKGQHPGIIVIEMPAISSTGPLSMQRGLGPTMEAMAGIAGLIGYPDQPLGSGSAYLDPMGALHGAAAALTAILHRDRTGEGQHVEVPQREAAMHWIGPAFLDVIENDAVYGPMGNAVEGCAPHGAYRCVGEDEWIAIAVTDDAQWRALRRVLAIPDDEAGAYDLAESRVQDRMAVDELIGRYVRGSKKADLAERLQCAGVPAAPVNNGRDLAHDPHLRANGWFVEFQHPAAGSHDYPGLPIVIDGKRLVPRRPSPPFGHHTDEVLMELCDVSAEELRRLRDCHAITERPINS